MIPLACSTHGKPADKSELALITMPSPCMVECLSDMTRSICNFPSTQYTKYRALRLAESRKWQARHPWCVHWNRGRSHHIRYYLTCATTDRKHVCMEPCLRPTHVAAVSHQHLCTSCVHQLVVNCLHQGETRLLELYTDPRLILAGALDCSAAKTAAASVVTDMPAPVEKRKRAAGFEEPSHNPKKAKVRLPLSLRHISATCPQ